jgi:hypothetical protein
VLQYSDEGMGHLITWFGSDIKREIQGQHAGSPSLPPPVPTTDSELLFAVSDVNLSPPT